MIVNNIHYRPMQAPERPLVTQMIKALYDEDPEGHPLPEAHISRTFEQLSAHPDYGTILVFEFEKQIIGYAVLINFWSNEYGGIVLSIDELYIVPEFRSQGIATHFIQYLHDTKFNNAVALELEVIPYNTRALKLYKKLGFETSNRHHLLW
ncbi:GNAT family N-acetyltransferase [Rhodocytophaga rosea]|uniref:GNAT family N-acetyltransferase n=1 Tax=Rhodocytophaga rosea TaxID=2704465 RepID=A0A6C0GQ16_9BACT|nr:GNAT family N-acetyltransferase [Rhodocytophaga rosea]QHT70156.1 GNAT family N-acetyltransferase [Rhodocytophaga rosea]